MDTAHFTNLSQFRFSSGLPWWLRWWRICLQGRRPRFDPWVRKIPWRREGLPIPVFLPGDFLNSKGSWSSSTLATWWEQQTRWERPSCWERLKAKEGAEEEILGSITNSMDMNLGKLREIVRDKEAWCVQSMGLQTTTYLITYSTHDLPLFSVTLIAYALKWSCLGLIHGWGYLCFSGLCLPKSSWKVTICVCVPLTSLRQLCLLCSRNTVFKQLPHHAMWVLHMSVLLIVFVSSLMEWTPL